MKGKLLTALVMYKALPGHHVMVRDPKNEKAPAVKAYVQEVKTTWGLADGEPTYTNQYTLLLINRMPKPGEVHKPEVWTISNENLISIIEG